MAPQSQEKLKDNLRELTSRSAGRVLGQVIEQVNQKLTGWIEYFRMARMKGFMQEIGQWLRRRLRCLTPEAMQADLRDSPVPDEPGGKRTVGLDAGPFGQGMVAAGRHAPSPPRHEPALVQRHGPD